MTTVTRSGVVPVTTTGDPVNHHQMMNDGRTILQVQNSGSTVARTVTFRIARTVDGQSVTPKAETVAAGVTEVFGPFPTDDYGGKMLIDVDHAELKLTPIRVP
ncbi:hypothetical protein [Streptomyces tsukubensis]|uniref:hypothetical protein n=1 Tax=Streptomyces tsukubensis TaxID=83656 RepID=UPI003450C6D0